MLGCRRAAIGAAQALAGAGTSRGRLGGLLEPMVARCSWDGDREPATRGRAMSNYFNREKRKRKADASVKSVDEVVERLFKYFPGHEMPEEVADAPPNAWVDDERWTRKQLARDDPGTPSPSEQHYPLHLGYFRGTPDLHSRSQISHAHAKELLTWFPLDKKNFPAGFPREVQEEFDLNEHQLRVLLREDTALLLTLIKQMVEAEQRKLVSKDASVAVGPVFEAGAVRDEEQVVARALQERTSGGTQQIRGNILVEGPFGAGKSVALVSAVQWAAEQEWVTWYIPDAAAFMSGGRFIKHGSGMWDTPIVASQALQWLLDANGDRLKAVQTKGLDRKDFPNLHAIAEAGVAGKQVSPVDAFCWAVEELLRCTERGVLLAVDNYAALYGHTGYGEWVSFKERKAIPPESLRAAVALRVLTRRPPKRGVCLAASRAHGPVSNKVLVPNWTGVTFPIRRMSWREGVRVLHYMLQTGSCSLMPKVSDFEYLFQLANGNWREVRRQIHECPISMQHKTV